MTILPDRKHLKQGKNFLFLFSVILLTLILVTPSYRSNILVNFREGFGRPVLKTICIAAGKVDFSGRKKKYISRTDLRNIKSELKPGDIIFRRNSDQLSNIAISGFWTHSGIYLGGKEEINDFFLNINLPDGLKPSEYIEQYFPDVSRKLAMRHNLVIEAVGEGVTINSIDLFANSDYFSAVRPVMSKDDLFRVLIAAFENFGRPYDFLFSQESNETLYCSEFVLKSFLKAGSNLHFSDSRLTDEDIITPNEIAVNVSGNDSSFQFILFYCADEHVKKAFRKNKEEFIMYAANQ